MIPLAENMGPALFEPSTVYLVFYGSITLGVLLFLLEFVIPHGVSAKIGALALFLGSGIAFAFFGAKEGLATLGGSTVFLVACGSLVFRRITSRHVQDGSYTVAGPQRMAMVGKRARSVSALRPGGVVEVATDAGAERVDAITRGEWIAPGTDVEVVAIEVSFVVVRAATARAQGSIE